MANQRVANQLRKKKKKRQEKQIEVDLQRIKAILQQTGTCEERSCTNKLSCPYYRKVPKDKRLKLQPIMNMLVNQIKYKIFPSMPSDEWMREHGTLCQDIKPSIVELHKLIT